jgi:hypothetical protein
MLSMNPSDMLDLLAGWIDEIIARPAKLNRSRITRDVVAFNGHIEEHQQQSSRRKAGCFCV